MAQPVTSLGSTFASVNPYSNKVLRVFPSLDAEEIDRAVEAAHRAFGSWREKSAEQRAVVVGKAAQLMRERDEDLAHLITLEMGKLIRHSRAELDLTIRILEYYADQGPAQIADEPLTMDDDGSAVIRNDPVGVLLTIQPWNFPAYQAIRISAPNLVLGNTILLKHATGVPQCALAIEELFADAGAPPGVFGNVFVDVPDLPRMVENPLVRACSLTGSDRAGSAFGENVGRSVKKVVLELGGSDPFIVLDGEDFERTLEAAFVARMHNMGQVCTSAKRMIVMSDVFDEFVSSLAERMSALEPGDPADEETTLAPLSSERAAQLLLDQVRDAIDKGGSVVTGGDRIDHPGAFVQPTVLTDVTPEMRAYTEELFGPVAVVYRVQSDDQAIALANDSPYGLGGAVFSSDGERAQAVADLLETGMVFINHPTASEPNLPFGGVKRSGFGRELSHLGILEFANRKLIATTPTEAPIRDALG
ncbi:MAG: NAD-dependent succinate-semialdehyde dehydrogenase [Solirubrobacteraceae bacterium]